MSWLKRFTARCAEPLQRSARDAAWRRAGSLAGVLLCAGCSQTPVPVPGQPSAPAAGTLAAQPPATAVPGAADAARPLAAPAWRRARDWDDYRLQAALRLVALNPEGTYSGPVHQPALAIPVLTIELNADGSVRQIQVLRRPRQALDTVQLAMAAVQRAAPFGSVAHLPRPWRFSETFLFDEQRRFKPRTLDL